MKLHKSCFYQLFTFFLCVFLLSMEIVLPVFATQDEFNAEAEERKNDPVESNEIENWPQGPRIGAKSAILFEANTGAILYAKNINEALYPASITKLMTCLIAVENCSLDEVITINQSAIDANEYDGSNMGLTAGEQLTLEELLHGILINSANEACNAVAEHIAGSMDAFVEMMNERAASLGCTNTHFVSTNGLHDDNHYTTAHDMALIAQAFFNYDVLCRLSNISDYRIEASDTHLEHYLHSKNRLYEGQEYAYESLLGSKTGFTSLSRQTLVSCAERDGMKLICVILMEESPYQFEDTISLFDYGFNNFRTCMVSELDNSYEINHLDFFNADNDLFGSTSPIISMNTDAYIILPNQIDFSEVESYLSYDTNFAPDERLAQINYYYNSVYLGNASIALTDNAGLEFNFIDPDSVSENYAATQKDTTEKNQVFVNIYHVLIAIVVVVVIIILVLAIRGVLANYNFTFRKRAKIAKRRRPVFRKRNPQVRRVPVKTFDRKDLSSQKENRNVPSGVNTNQKRNVSKKRNVSRTPNPQNWEKRNQINFKDFDF